MVKLRLARSGRKKLPIYRIVAADSRARRDGRFIEVLGQYSPKDRPATLTLKESRVMHWLRVGAQPTDTVRSLLSGQGILLRWHLEKKGKDPSQVAEEVVKWEAAQTAKKSKMEGRKVARRTSKAKKAAAAVEAPATPAA